MIASLLSQDALRERLRQECSTHARAVDEVVVAQRSGDLDPAVALRTCAFELHSLKGVASVLGLASAMATIGELCEAMLQRGSLPDPTFLTSFQSWFSELLVQVNACANGLPDAAALEALSMRREALVTTLGYRAGAARPYGAADSPRPLSPSAGRRLLLVDDSATVRAALSARLVDRGYPVRTAKSLTETARIIDEFDPEIVITDVCMPSVPGDELCRRIKAHMRRVVPVLLYSSLPEEELSARARSAGADGYVCKISGVEALIERMDELLAEEILF